jgi:hypothetical protein
MSSHQERRIRLTRAGKVRIQSHGETDVGQILIVIEGVEGGHPSPTAQDLCQVFLESVTEMEGDVIWRNAPGVEQHRRVATMMTELLQEALQRGYIEEC